MGRRREKRDGFHRFSDAATDTFVIIRHFSISVVGMSAQQ
jgi:hypothetical protein